MKKIYFLSFLLLCFSFSAQESTSSDSMVKKDMSVAVSISNSKNIVGPQYAQINTSWSHVYYGNLSFTGRYEWSVTSPGVEADYWDNGTCLYVYFREVGTYLIAFNAFDNNGNWVDNGYMYVEASN